MKIKLDRANASSLVDVVKEIVAAHENGEAWGDATSEVLIDRIIQRYSGHVTAALRAKGVPIEDGEVLDGAALLRIVNERSGLEIAEWTPGAIKTALDEYMARRLSDAIGVEIDSVQDLEAVKQALIDAAAEAVVSGRATAFISRAMIKRMRVAKAWQAGGVEPDDRRKTLARWYQKKYRRSHVAVWR